ncbi:ribonuclease Z [Alkalihalobacillus pseudalcaliphilus]|uniref:ribonuclease Z n=1 Tax=Alkalihalobacillus pseudalcaliphilus TaxID=79884 RepID=UPI00064D98C4|nr:ribonuclease Z [Alkalihalobacillus pseudalcaliphilus]KMK76394.1 ribonuclease Z [Alkalihalobacillus pseudalcaliphilus]
MEFYFLGTGAGIPATKRNVSGLALRFLKRNGPQWLFDCGEATQHQILQTPISLTKIEKIFISHLHGDHIFGLPGLIGSRSFQGATTELIVYGPKGIEEFVTQSLKISQTYLKYPINFIEVTEEKTLFHENGIKVEAFPLDHVMPSFAYKLTEDDKQGELLVNKLQEFDIQPGPIYQKIKNQEAITLADGTNLDVRQFVGPSKKGRTVIVAGDTRPKTELIDFSKHADLLIHEATFRSELEEQANKFGHSTIKNAASIADRANVKQLILTHISSRYVDEDEALLQEAKQFFKETLIAHDQMYFKLK